MRRFAHALSILVLALASGRAAAQTPTSGTDAQPRAHVETRPRRAAVITGLAVLGGAWGFSTLAASFAVAEHDDHFAPLYIPIVGPLVTIETAGLDWNGRRGWMGPPDRLPIVLLVLDSLVQTAGAITFIAGMSAVEVSEVPAATVRLTPTVHSAAGAATPGLELSGSF